MFGGVEIQLQSLKFSSSKMKESKTRDCFWYFWLKSSLQKLGCRHIDDGVEGQRRARCSPVRGLALSRADQIGEQDRAFTPQPPYRSALTSSKKKKEKKERSCKTILEGKFQLPDPRTTSPFMLTVQQTEEK